MKKTTYTIGFVFNTDFSRVALIRKNKPAWQAGKLNGIGGHIEDGESPDACMVREFSEEADYPFELKWHGFAEMGADDFTVFCFAAIGNPDAITARTDEPIEVEPTVLICPHRQDMIENLPWLIALAIDHLQDGRPVYSEITYPNPEPKQEAA